MKAVALENKDGSPAKRSLRVSYNSWTVSMAVVSERGDRLAEESWPARTVQELAEHRQQGGTMEGDAIEITFDPDEARFEIVYKNTDWNPTYAYMGEDDFCEAITDLGIADCA